MVQHASQPSPRSALARWLAQLHYNAIRNVETIHPTAIRTDNDKPLRGVLVADDLFLTRQRQFFRCQMLGTGEVAVPMSLEEVAANYNLDAMQSRYRSAADAWKNIRRSMRR